MNDLPPTTRLVSIDCIRILAMLLICVCHAAGGTGLMQVQDGDFNKAIALLIGVFSNIGVNLFILISGYCGILLKHKPERYFKLWLQVVFFTLLYLPCAISNHYFNSVSSLLGEILPIPLASGYWFFTAYTGLFILMPYLNHLIHQLSARQRYTLIVSLLFLFCILNRANTPELAGSGFNVIWLASIYLIGAVL